MKKSILKYIAIFLLGFTATSCHHKDLLYEDVEVGDIKVLFDWRNAPDATPASMEVFFFDNSTSNETRFNFTDKVGGTVELQAGKYNALGINSDISNWANMRNINDIETFEIYTSEVTQLQSYSLDPSSLPKARGSEDERIVSTPRMIWSGRQDTVTVTHTSNSQIITIYPQEDVCHYTVDIYDVANINSIDGSTIDATISGMAESYLHGKHKPTDTSATMPFSLSVNSEKTGLHSEFLTFGESQENRNSHIVSLYIILDDGTKHHYTFDVTDQVQNSADPTHVHIIIKGLNLPKAKQTGQGLVPEVNDWTSEHVNISM